MFDKVLKTPLKAANKRCSTSEKLKPWSYAKIYHTCRFSTLTINFSEVCPRQILELGKQFNLMIRLQNILKASLQDVLKMS